jgi:CRP/FNR family transcriptional regulator, anaerobic regulatory protein
MERLLFILHQIAPLSAALDLYLRSIIICIKYQKGEFLLNAGETANRIFYIEKGLVRSFYSDDGKETTNWFMKEDDFCISVVSFLEQQPSEDSLIALEDCVTWGISHEQLEKTYKLFPEFERHGRIITGKYYVWSELRYRSIIRKKGSEIYARLMETDPDIARRVPVKDLASFMNVSERTLSRIRREYSAEEKKKPK